MNVCNHNASHLFLMFLVLYSCHVHSHVGYRAAKTDRPMMTECLSLGRPFAQRFCITAIRGTE